MARKYASPLISFAASAPGPGSSQVTVRVLPSFSPTLRAAPSGLQRLQMLFEVLHHPARRFSRVCIRREFSRTHPIFDSTADQPQPPTHRLRGPLFQLRVDIVGLHGGIEYGTTAGDRRVVDQAAQHVYDGEEALYSSLPARQRRLEPLAHKGRRVIKGRTRQLVFARKVVVDAALLEACLSHEVVHRSARVPFSVEESSGPFDDHASRAFASAFTLIPHSSASTTARRQRDTHTGFSSSSCIRTSQTWFLLLTWTGVPTAVSAPERLGLRWLALIS